MVERIDAPVASSDERAMERHECARKRLSFESIARLMVSRVLLQFDERCYAERMRLVAAKSHKTLFHIGLYKNRGTM
jgi:hypothetical protein